MLNVMIAKVELSRDVAAVIRMMLWEEICAAYESDAVEVVDSHLESLWARYGNLPC